MLQLTVQVRSFIPQAMRDDSEAQSFAVYDGTQLVVLEPKTHAGRVFCIYHEGEVPAQSPWRRVNQRLRMRLPESLLEPGNQIFAGAVQDLQIL